MKERGVIEKTTLIDLRHEKRADGRPHPPSPSRGMTMAAFSARGWPEVLLYRQIFRVVPGGIRLQMVGAVGEMPSAEATQSTTMEKEWAAMQGGSSRTTAAR